jgi:hypothetical protein
LEEECEIYLFCLLIVEGHLQQHIRSSLPFVVEEQILEEFSGLVVDEDRGDSDLIA